MIKHIIHLSDIHIRSGDLTQSRFYLYLHIFEKLSESIISKHFIKEEVIIVITGDIFHVKNNADSTGIYLFNYLMNKLNTLCDKIILIYGNHDFKQHEPNEPGILHSILLNSGDIYNILLLDDTGIYTYKNITISLVAIKDTLIKNDTFGSIPIFPEFIQPDIVEGQTRIALFHGNIYTGKRIDWLIRSKCHAGLLGDIHIPAITKIDNFTFGYPGSLIQQNYGEALLGHGYIIWDIQSDCSISGTHVSLPAAKEGYISIVIGKNTFSELNMIITSEFCPELLRIKTEIPIAEIIPLLENANKKYIFERVNEIKDCYFQSQPHSASLNNLKELDKSAILPKSWPDYIKEKLNCTISLPDDIKLSIINVIADKIKIRNNKLAPMLKNIDAPAPSEHNNDIMNITHLEFGWLFCYADNNIIEFNDGSPIKVISGDNSSGKSSIFDIIILGLYSKQIESRKSDNYIHSAILPGHNAWIKVTINDTFIISREFTIIPSKNKHQRKIDIKSKLISKTLGNVILSGNPLISEWINKNVGSYEHFLLLCMVSQNNDYAFFRMSSKEKMAILDKMLNIELMHRYNAAIQESIIAHDFIIKHLLTMRSIYSKNMGIVEIIDLSDLITKLNAEKIQRDKIIETRLVIKQLMILIAEEKSKIKEDAINEPIYEDNIDTIEKQIFELSGQLHYHRKKIQAICLNSRTPLSKSHNRPVIYTQILDLINKDTICPECNQIRKLLNDDCIKQPNIIKSKVADSSANAIAHADADADAEDEANPETEAILRNKIIHLQNYLSYKKIEELNSKVIDLRKSISNIEVSVSIEAEYISLVKQNERNIRNNEEAIKNISVVAEIDNGISEYKNKIKILDQILCLSKGYRDWVYRESIIPFLCKEVNSLISNLLNVNWKLIAEIIDDELHWNITNGTITSGISTCGGYREFIFGIAIRIALAKYYHIEYAQMFIDEGFVAGSSINIQEIPDFLNYVNNKYKISLVLISHMNILANCGKHIKINSDYSLGVSSINYSSKKQGERIVMVGSNATASSVITTQSVINMSNKCIALLKSGKQCTAKQKIEEYCLRHYCKA